MTLRWIGVAALHAASALGMAGALASAPDPSGEVALVFSPLSTPAQALDAAASTGGRVVRVGMAPWIVVVAPAADAAALAARAKAAGAWLQLNPIVARGCARKTARNL